MFVTMIMTMIPVNLSQCLRDAKLITSCWKLLYILYSQQPFINLEYASRSILLCFCTDCYETLAKLATV